MPMVRVPLHKTLPFRERFLLMVLPFTKTQQQQFIRVHPLLIMPLILMETMRLHW